MAADFTYTEVLPLGADETPYRLLTTDGISTFDAAGETFLRVDPSVLSLLTRTAMHDLAHLLRAGPLQQLRDFGVEAEASA
jgi:fumarate hydratase class I